MAIIYEKSGRIATLTINRPERRNAVDFETGREMNEAIADFDRDSDLWVLILTGAGDVAFSAGGDLRDWSGVWANNAVKRTVLEPETWKPVIAAINGMAIGGGLERALRCDFRIAAEHARLRFSEAGIGLLPPTGVLLLPRLIGQAWALEAMTLAEWMSAEEAYRIGLVHRVAPAGKLMEEAVAYAEKLCEVGPLSVRAIKEILWSTMTMSLDEASRFSYQVFQKLLASEDAKEGPRSFSEKRKPVFQAR
jgi:enoyl-CoA hydratase/carnithine racemase